MKAETKQAARMKPWKGWALVVDGYEPRLFGDRWSARYFRVNAGWPDARVVRVVVREVRPSTGKRRAHD